MQRRSKIILASAVAGLIGLTAIGAAVAEHRRHGGGWGMHGGGYGKHWRHHGMHRHVKEFARRYDANKDKKISQDEIDTNRTDWHKKFDTDGNGTLSMKEFESLWLEAKRRRMVRSFQRLDDDGNGSITLEEYTDPLSNVVERWDRNGDGVLSRADRRHRHRRREHRRHRQNDNDRRGSDDRDL